MVFTSFFKAFTQSDFKKADELNGIEVGMPAPDFSAIDQFDTTFNLKSALQNGPVVLVFYRGQWCPFCNKHLSDLQDSLKLITDQGATVVAISPEKTEYLKKMADKTDAIYTLLYDQNYTIAESYGVLFQADKSTRIMYNTVLGANLSEAHNNENELLPIPATYIIGQDGVVLWRQFDPNYKKRSTISEILENLPKK